MPFSIASSMPAARNVPENTSFLPRAVMSMKPPQPAVTCGRKPSFDTLTLPSAPTSRNDRSPASKPPPWKYVNW